MNNLLIELTSDDIKTVRSFLGKAKFEQGYSKSNLPTVVLTQHGTEHYNFDEEGLFNLALNILNHLEPWDFPNHFRVEIFPGLNLAKMENEIFCFYQITEKNDLWSHALSLKAYLSLIIHLAKNHQEIKYNQTSTNANISSISMELLVPVNITTISEGLNYGYSIFSKIRHRADRILNSFDAQMDAFLDFLE